MGIKKTSPNSTDSNDFEYFSREVLNKLIEDNINPTPHNFSLYFERLLEEKPESFRRKIGNIIELEQDNEDDINQILGTNLQKGFFSVKNLLKLNTTVYQNISLMNKIIKEKEKALSNSSTTEISDIYSSLNADVEKLKNVLNNQLSNMKVLYDETATILKNVDEQTVFDNQYGVYNKRFLIQKMNQELHLIKEFGHKSSLISLRLSKESISLARTEKELQIMIRTISKLLVKTSRRSDLVFYYENGIFVLLLKHTNITQAENACQRLYELIDSSNFFLSDRELNLKIVLGVVELNNKGTSERILSCALESMFSADLDKNKYYLIGEYF